MSLSCEENVRTEEKREERNSDQQRRYIGTTSHRVIASNDAALSSLRSIWPIGNYSNCKRIGRYKSWHLDVASTYVYTAISEECLLPSEDVGGKADKTGEVKQVNGHP